MPGLHSSSALRVHECEAEGERHSDADLVRARNLMRYRKAPRPTTPAAAENETLRRQLERAEAELAQQRQVLAYLMQKISALPAAAPPARTYFAHLAAGVEVGRTQMTSELMADLVADD